MIANLKPYPKYKESGLPWVRTVPAHWDVIPNRGLIRKKKILVGDRHTEYQLLSLTKQGVIIRDISTGKGKFSSDMGTSQEVRKGDLVFCLFDVPETPRTVGLSQYAGMITGAYSVFQAIGKGDIRYLEAFYLAMDDRKLLSPLYSGLRHTIPPGKLLGTKTPQPPTDEQSAIVRFLDWANGRIDRTIRAKRRVIALLNEQKQTVIHHAVTRGLDPCVTLKPSGISWIDDIPAHWRVLRAKFIYSEADDRSADGSEELLSVSHITGVTPRSQKNITMFKAASYAGHKLCRPGDLVVNTMWAWMGALGVSEHTGIVSPAYAVYRPYHPNEITGEFIDGLLRSRPYISNIICRSTGLRASRLRLYPEEFFRLPLILPPAEEQHRIVDAIRLQTAELTKSILRYQREIQLLREYRTRLVADVVTGKLDVREAVAALPDGDLSLDNVVEEGPVEPDEESEELVEEGLAN